MASDRKSLINSFFDTYFVRCKTPRAIIGSTYIIANKINRWAKLPPDSLLENQDILQVVNELGLEKKHTANLIDLHRIKDPSFYVSLSVKPCKRKEYKKI
jgi:hypothetical protein